MVESSGEATDRKLRGLSSGAGKVYRQYSGKGYKEPLCLPSQDFLLEILPIALLHGSQFESPPSAHHLPEKLQLQCVLVPGPGVLALGASVWLILTHPLTYFILISQM